jgi:transcriptional regulator
MYIPANFEITDKTVIDQFIENHAFGQLISNHKGRLFSTHMPFLHDAEKNQLLGHIAKANPQHQDIEGQEVMVTLEGAHGYISPNWYATKNVPTWNYQAAHIYVQCTVFTDPERLQEVLDSLTAMHERHLPKPWLPEYQATKLNGIVGLELNISKIECKFKLNQNRSAADIQGVIDHLDPVKQANLLAAMKLHLNTIKSNSA